MNWKQLIKKALYTLKLFSLFHQLRNKQNLTVVMLHRVLPTQHKGWQFASPEWTVSTDFLEQLLKFVTQHYNVVSVDQVHSYCNGGKSLPAHPLLITIDDGWKDTFRYAHPLLEQYELPSVVFISSNSINKPVLSWQEALDYLDRSQTLGPEDLLEIETELHLEGLVDTWQLTSDIWSVIQKIDKTPDIDREKALATITTLFSKRIPTEPLMMNSEEITSLSTSKMAIGGHGHLHEPLTRFKHPQHHLAKSQEKLAEHNYHQKINSMSFPHSQYNDEIVEAASSSGFDILFGGGMKLQPLNKLRKAPQVISRVNIDQQGLTDSNGKLLSHKLAHQLFFARTN